VRITSNVVSSNPTHVRCTRDKVCQCLAEGRWFSPGAPVSSKNRNYLLDITKILMKVALNTIILTLTNKLQNDFSLQQVLFLEETWVPGENHRPSASHWQTLSLVHLTWVGFELTTLVVIGTDYIVSYKSNYHTIKTTTAPFMEL
jgi:hypothetical protein